ncbi:MAG: nucleoside hydrolase [Pseudomonadota bacterium]
MTRKIIIDTDPGIDDAMAIVYAFSDPMIEVLGLTTVFGNVPVTTATRNACALLTHIGRTVPVAQGAARPLVQAPAPHPDFVHGRDGFGGVAIDPPAMEADNRHAAAFLIDMLKANPGEITLVPVGPLTNLAIALEREPAITDLVAEVVVMGGAVRTRGNITEHAEANIWQDPHAAEKVLNAPWPMRMVGLDVTERVRCVPADFDRLAAARPQAGGFLRDAGRFYMDFHAKSVGFDGCFMHDPSAIIAVSCPDLFDTEAIALSARCEGEEIGATRPTDDGRAAVDVCLDVRSESVRERFLDIISAGPLS